jgi:hypothetical protein
LPPFLQPKFFTAKRAKTAKAYPAEIWRYPVKSLRGESLAAAEAGPEGIFGDRLVQVRNGRGRVVTARTRPRLLGLQGTLGPDKEFDGVMALDCAIPEGGPIAVGDPVTLL